MKKQISKLIVIAFFGLKMELVNCKLGLNLDENLINVDTEKFETSVSSIFAIGDINSTLVN